MGDICGWLPIPSQLTLSKRRPQERSMSPVLVARGLFPQLKDFKVSSKLEGLPDGHDKVTTYGSGGGFPIGVDSGPLTGWTVGGGKRSQVYGKSWVLYRTMGDSAASELLVQLPPRPSGFPEVGLGILAYLGSPRYLLQSGSPKCERRTSTNLTTRDTNRTSPPKYYESLPQNITRPGGELVEMMITPLNVTVDNSLDLNTTTRKTTIVPYRPFFFVSDNYTTSQVKSVIKWNCTAFSASDPISFNSTGNIQPGSVLQLYRGDTAAMILQGYDNANEQRDNPNLAPNPPFPSNVSVDAWLCMNATIGRSIPLMHGPRFRPWKLGLEIAGSILLTGLIVWGLYKCLKKDKLEKRRKKKEEQKKEREEKEEQREKLREEQERIWKQKVTANQYKAYGEQLTQEARQQSSRGEYVRLNNKMDWLERGGVQPHP